MVCFELLKLFGTCRQMSLADTVWPYPWPYHIARYHGTAGRIRQRQGLKAQVPSPI